MKQVTTSGPELSPRDSYIALLAGLSLFLSTIEYLFPKPLPAFRLGLANLPVLLSFGVLRPREILLLGFFKVLGQALVNGTLASYVFLFSLGGTAASLLVMTLWYYAFKGRTSYLGISLAGALASNVVQVALSLSFVFGESAWVIVPYLLTLGTATGVLIGFFAMRFSATSRWFASTVSELGLLPSGMPGGAQLAGDDGTGERSAGQSPGAEKSGSRRRGTKYKAFKRELRKKLAAHTTRNVHPLFMFAAGLVLLILFVTQSRLDLRIVQTGILFAAAFLIGKGPSLGYFLSLIFGVTFFSLLQPLGRVLVTVAGFSITESALTQGLYRGLTLTGLVLSSLIMIQPKLRIPGRPGFFLTRIFAYYEQVNQRRSGLTARGLVGSLDGILADIWKPGEQARSIPTEADAAATEGREPSTRTSPQFAIAGVLLIGVFIFMSAIDT